jgi:hypothetical protein
MVPLLATSTDEVGTKVAIAQVIDKHDIISQYLVGMVVDKIIMVGAKPPFMTDYIACGKAVPALVGGETEEKPDFWATKTATWWSCDRRCRIGCVDWTAPRRLWRCRHRRRHPVVRNRPSLNDHARPLRIRTGRNKVCMVVPCA